LTQTEFGRRIGTSGATISTTESGKTTPDNQTLLLICHKFGVRREWLEHGEEPMRVDHVDDAPHSLVPELVEVLSDHPAVLAALRRVVRIMTPADWDRLNEIIDAVMEEQEKNTPEA
jgi:transcriptional regulator with XRE-family HTH domain